MLATVLPRLRGLTLHSCSGMKPVMSKPPPASDPNPDDPDNSPQDPIQFREYKILLRPERFTGPGSYREFWGIVRRTAKKFELKIEENPDSFENQVRSVSFFDTADFDLYNNHFIARLRTLYRNGWPAATPELTVKFRHPDLNEAASVDIHPAVPGACRIKFKEELLPMNDRLGAMRSIFSHNCILALPRLAADLAFEDIVSVFPAFSRVPCAQTAKVRLVNNVHVEEIQSNVGVIRFGHGFQGKATVGVWRNRHKDLSIVGEFAFQCKFNRLEEVHRGSMAKADAFYCAVQLDASDWVQLRTTKTAMVYGTGKKKPQTRE